MQYIEAYKLTQDYLNKIPGDLKSFCEKNGLDYYLASRIKNNDILKQNYPKFICDVLNHFGYNITFEKEIYFIINK